MNGKVNSDFKADTDESIRFWSDIWDSKVHHGKDAEWLREQRAGKDDRKQEDIAITVEMVTQQTRKIPNWECPGPDGAQGYWLKNLTKLYKRIADQLNELLNGKNEIPN